MRAAPESASAATPPDPHVELGEQCQEPVGRGVDVGRELGDLVAEGFGVDG
jgi:hypothetical protein